eukprot:s319_g16.t1
MVVSEEDAMPEDDEAKHQVLGFVALYVDDVMCVGEEPAVQGFLEVLQRTWKCSTPEVVTEGRWMKFCGFELSRRGDSVLLSQHSYLKDVVGRYKDLSPRATPLPGSLDETPEENPQLADVRAAQTVVGELLWAACRTRPDLSYSVAWLGRNVMRCPKRVLMYAKHTLGYISQTVDVCLSYSKDSGGYGKDDQLSFQRTMRTVEIFSDAALGPEGKRGHQGLIAAPALLSENYEDGGDLQ